MDLYVVVKVFYSCLEANKVQCIDQTLNAYDKNVICNQYYNKYTTIDVHMGRVQCTVCTTRPVSVIACYVFKDVFVFTSLDISIYT